MKKLFLSELPYGILLSLLCVFLYFQPASFLETLELKFYDLRSRWRTPNDPSKNIAMIAIDEDSIAKIGRWPWPRSKIAELLTLLNKEDSRPRTIGLDILFSEPEQNQGLVQIDGLRHDFRQSLEAKIEETGKIKPKFSNAPAGVKQAFSWWQKTLETDRQILDNMDAAYVALDNDTKLEAAISTASNVIVPLFFITGTEGKPEPPSDAMLKSAIVTQQALSGPGTPQESFLLQSAQAIFPLERFLTGAQGIGHVNIEPDSDGSMRRETVSIGYAEHTFASFAVQLVRHYLGLASEDVLLDPGRSLMLGSTAVLLDGRNSFALTFNKPFDAFQTYSFFDVLNGKISSEAFKDKIIIVGPTAAGIGNSYVTPVGPNLPGVEVVANTVDNLIQKRFLTRPDWAVAAELAALALFGLFISFLLPRLKALPGALVSLTALSVMLAAGVILFVNYGQWLKVIYPSFVLTAGYVIVISKRFLTTERKKEHIEGESIETNKMLGLSFQGQGMLDLAFEKFRKCPVDESMKELLYNLGLDFERKRQFNKAAAVYEHIAKVDAKYKDVPQKMDTLKKISEGAIIGGPAARKSEGTMVLEGSSAKPTLGRYELVKELGKGAMGIVYLGRDPKINRQVAIKTMRFEDDVNAAAMKEIKERFFREAESAGNLSHPNILKIYDAGEEQDICYIAMELLEGEDLKKYTEKSALLPIKKVVELTASAAEALDYAHQQGVVHRDIKPANLMILKDRTLRLTDFGIARITASSRTATGTVLGTPSYMSPEQIAGKKVDGRSDLFSLGVMLFELLTGEKPWKGGDSIGSILFQIANDPHPDPQKIRSEIPEALSNIIARALAKKPEERYQRGGDMAKDLRSFLEGKPLTAKTSAPATGILPARQTGISTASTKEPNIAANAPSAPQEPSKGKTSEPARVPEGPRAPAPAAKIQADQPPGVKMPSVPGSTQKITAAPSTSIPQMPQAQAKPFVPAMTKASLTETTSPLLKKEPTAPPAAPSAGSSAGIQKPPSMTSSLQPDNKPKTAAGDPPPVGQTSPEAERRGADPAKTSAPPMAPQSDKAPLDPGNLNKPTSKPLASTPLPPKTSTTPTPSGFLGKSFKTRADDKKDSTTPLLDDEIKKKLEMLEKTLPIITAPPTADPTKQPATGEPPSAGGAAPPKGESPA
ncbi:MAG: CHASE2 domain-containing protein [Elusimicrobia bacterium]|nr:CHASE2 domain-containing protein [Elusimicrobiota bacterium]